MNKSFKAYTEKLKNLSVSKSLIAGEKVVLLLSGASTLSHAELSVIQKEAVAGWKTADINIVPSHFPYNKDYLETDPKYPSLLSASLNNVFYYFHCWKNKEMQNEIRRHILPVLSCSQVVIITLSSGIHMLEQFLEGVGELDKEVNLTVIALGPVSHKRVQSDNISLTVIKGREDRYSRFLDFHEVDQWVDSNHFDYLKNEEVCDFIEQKIREHSC